MTRPLLRWAEFVCVFVLLPITAFVFREPLKAWLLPILCLLALGCLLLILTDERFKRFRLTNYGAIRPQARVAAGTFAAGAMASLLIFALWLPDKLFNLPLSEPLGWLLLIAIYPLFSVIPQELIFRTYLFHRFKGIMPAKRVRVLVSAAVFALAHIIYANWIAVALAFVGGLLFAQTYASSRSTAACVLEHSLWGLWLFTLGAGQYLTLQAS